MLGAYSDRFVKIVYHGKPRNSGFFQERDNYFAPALNFCAATTVMKLLKQDPFQTCRRSKCGELDEGEKTFYNIKLYQLVAQAVFDHFERVCEDEPNCSEVMVGPDMKPEDVVRMVLEKVNVK